MTNIVEYSQTEAALGDLADRYAAVLFDVSSVKGMDSAKKARAEIRGYRVALEAKRVEIKAPALEHCRLIDAEAKRITGELVALEVPIDEQIKAQEARRDAEKKEKERIEKELVEAEQRAIKEAQEAELAAARAEIERQQAELAKAAHERAEADRLARLKIEEEERAARQRIEEKERASRLAIEAAEREARKAREAEEAKAKAARDAEETKLKAERDKIESERRAVEEKQRKEREAEEAKQREIQRRMNEKLDALQILETFRERFGHVYEFGGVVSAINEVLNQEKEAA
jgi:colicin import membrane protein